MKIVIKIAKTELKKMFFSPIAWVLGVIFMMVSGYYFFDIFENLTIYQDSMIRLNPEFDSMHAPMTSAILNNGKKGFFVNIVQNLYLFIPLLTMGLINNEYSNGTSKLLFTSPIKVSQIVWGKYASVVLYNLILMVFAFLLVIIGFLGIQNFDWGIASSIMLSMFLLICAYSAIGMFMSSITHYQIVSAISTFILLFLLNNIGTVWQEYDYIRNITYHLSLSGRTRRMGGMIVTSRDVFYFVFIILLFVYFTYLSLKHGLETVSKFKKLGRYACAILLVITLLIFTSKPGYIAYWDPTRGDNFTIDTVTQKIIKELNEGELEVTLYTNLLSRGFAKARPSSRNDYIYDIWEKYRRFKPDINLKFVDYYDVLDEYRPAYEANKGISLDSFAHEKAIRDKAIFKNYLKPSQIKSIINLQEEQVGIVMHLKYKHRSIFLRTYNDGLFWPEEYHFAAAFKRLASDTVPMVYVSTGNLERSIYKKGERELSNFSIEKALRKSLINSGFEFDTINLAYSEVPKDAYALLIADPKVNLSETALNNVSKHLAGGGNLLALGEINKQQVLNPIVEPLGVSLMPGTLVHVSKHETPDKVLGHVTLDWVTLVATYEEQISNYKKELSHGHSMISVFPGTTHIAYKSNEYKFTKAIVTSPKDRVWSKINPLIIDSVAPVMNPKEGDYVADTFVIAAALEKTNLGKQQRIGIVGDADFLSNLRQNSHKLGVDYMSWMSQGAFPIDIPKAKFKDDLFLVSSGTVKTLSVIFLWIIPAILSLTGILLLLRRRRH